MVEEWVYPDWHQWHITLIVWCPRTGRERMARFLASGDTVDARCRECEVSLGDGPKRVEEEEHLT